MTTKLRVGLEANASADRVEHTLHIIFINCIDDGLVGRIERMRHEFLHTSHLSSKENLTRRPRTHHLMVGASHIHLTSINSVQSLVGACMLAYVLVHPSSIHHVEELTSSTDASHRDGIRDTILEKRNLVVVTMDVAKRELMRPLIIEGRMNVLPPSKLNEISKFHIAHHHPAMSFEHTFIVVAAINDKYLTHCLVPR